jgi:hypothetical protein
MACRFCSNIRAVAKPLAKLDVIGRFKTSHLEALQNQPILFMRDNVTDVWGAEE